MGDTETTTTPTTGESENFIVQAWNQIVSFFTSNVWAIVAFFVTLVVGVILIKVVLMILKKILKKKQVDGVAAKFVVTIIRFLLYLVLVLVLLSIIGVSVGGITTAMSAAILAIGMALKDFLSNVASGLILVGSQKYKEGDYIVVSGVEGCVVDINFIFTTLKTPDGKQVTLPNSTMTNNPVTNLGAYPTRRVGIIFSVAYETDCELVAKVVTDVMKANGKIYLDPAPTCRLKELSASSIDFNCMCWCDKEDYWDVYYYLMENVYNEFKRNGISVPYMQVETRERKDEVKMPVIEAPLPPRVEKKRAVRRKLTYEDYEDMTLKEFHRVFKENSKERAEKRKKKKAEKASK